MSNKDSKIPGESDLEKLSKEELIKAFLKISIRNKKLEEGTTSVIPLGVEFNSTD